MSEITLALLTLPQAAQLTGLTVSNLRRAVLDGKLAAISVGDGATRKHRRVTAADLADYVASLKGSAIAARNAEQDGEK